MSQGVDYEVLKVHAKTRISLSAYRSECSSELLLQGLPVYPHAPCHDDSGLSH